MPLYLGLVVGRHRTGADGDGHVMDAQNMAVSGAAVSLIASDRRAVEMRTGADETIRVADVVPDGTPCASRPPA